MMDADIDIDKMLKEIEDKGEISPSENKQVEKTKKELELDVEDINSIAESLVSMTADDRKKADEVFRMFFTSIGHEKDRSESSKEALTRSLELKIEASRNLIELLKIKTKANEMKTNIGLMFNTMPGKKAGIDLGNIKKERGKRHQQ
jgi:hypothetical protein